jgi:hypothetical protein
VISFISSMGRTADYARKFYTRGAFFMEVLALSAIISIIFLASVDPDNELYLLNLVMFLFCILVILYSSLIHCDFLNILL